MSRTMDLCRSRARRRAAAATMLSPRPSPQDVKGRLVGVIASCSVCSAAAVTDSGQGVGQERAVGQSFPGGGLTNPPSSENTGCRCGRVHRGVGTARASRRRLATWRRNAGGALCRTT